MNINVILASKKCWKCGTSSGLKYCRNEERCYANQRFLLLKVKMRLLNQMWDVYVYFCVFKIIS
jgi:hypothetical protein